MDKSDKKQQNDTNDIKKRSSPAKTRCQRRKTTREQFNAEKKSVSEAILRLAGAGNSKCCVWNVTGK